MFLRTLRIRVGILDLSGRLLEAELEQLLLELRQLLLQLVHVLLPKLRAHLLDPHGPCLLMMKRDRMGSL